MKNGDRLRSVRGSRISIHMTQINAKKWVSTLTISNLKVHDEATYSFVAYAGKARVEASKILYVSSRRSSDVTSINSANAFLTGLYAKIAGMLCVIISSTIMNYILGC